MMEFDFGSHGSAKLAMLRVCRETQELPRPQDDIEFRATLLVGGKEQTEIGAFPYPSGDGKTPSALIIAFHIASAFVKDLFPELKENFHFSLSDDGMVSFDVNGGLYGSRYNHQGKCNIPNLPNAQDNLTKHYLLQCFAAMENYALAREMAPVPA